MADETTVPAGASNDPQKAGDVPAVPEPQILEETIIHKVAAAEKKPVAAPKFAPLPNVKGMAMPPKPMPPEEISAAAPIPAQIPAPATVPPPQMPAPVAATAIPEMPAPVAPPKVQLPKPEEIKPAPAAAPIQQATPETQTKTLEGDISGILKGVQLPERHNPDEGKAAAAKQFDTKLGAAAAQAVSVMPTSPEAAAAATPKDPDDIVAVHTLKDDLQHVVHDQKISVVRAVSLEEDRRTRQKREPGAPSMKKKTHRLVPILFSVVLLLVLGVAAIFGVYTIASQRSGDQQSGVSSTSSILFAESSVVFPLDNRTPEDLKNTLAQARNSPQGTLGSITRIIPTVSTTSPDGSTQTRAATFSEFMAAIGAQVPDELLRALSDQFFFGIHTVDTNAPIFVIPVTSYDHAFAGMLAWEETMNADLSPVFTSVPALTAGPNGIPTQRTFQDLVMKNYDVRALEDDSGNIVLYYSFPTQNLLVIAESPYSFTEILSRLQAQGEL